MNRMLCSDYVSNLDSNVYSVYNLPEEVIAVLFAFYSRSEGSLRENLQKMIDEGHVAPEPDWGKIGNSVSGEKYVSIEKFGVEPSWEVEEFKNKKEKKLKDFLNWLDFKKNHTTQQAKEFHEKWVVGYSHGSVAEHAVVHLAVENVSMLAAKAIEDCRLASYTEKSTRYVNYKDVQYHIPIELNSPEIRDEYIEHCNSLMANYNSMLDIMMEEFSKQDSTLKPYQVKGKACDVCRGILPASVHTNLGITANARELEHMISKLMSDPSEEMRGIGQQIKQEALKICPTLIKYADENVFNQTMETKLDSYISDFNDTKETSMFTTSLNSNMQKESVLIKNLAANILYPYSNKSINDIKTKLGKKGEEYCWGVVDTCLKNRGPHDSVPRAFESIMFEHEIDMDFGAYRDIQRHRMNTQLSQNMMPKSSNAFAIPKEINDNAKLKEQYQKLMIESYYTYLSILAETNNEYISQYCLPMCFQKRVLFKWNLRELFHFIELRSKPQGHDNYRRVAKNVWHSISAEYPRLASLIRVNLD